MADTPITIRDCAEADIPVLEHHDPRPDADLAREHYAATTAGNARFLVAFIDDEPAGWAMLDCTDDDLTPQLSHLWVFPEARRHGVGRALARRVEDTAAGQGYQEIFLMVDPDNGQAVPLWLDLGYKPTGEHQLGEVDETGEQTHQAIYRKSLRH